LTRHQRSAFEPLARGQSPPWRVKGNGSDEVTLQVFPHARYIDEVVGLRVKDQGRMYAHQAEGDQGGSLKDWNVTALTDLTGRVIEQYWYSPYGQLEAHVAAHPFDFDDDGDVDAQDIAAGTSGGTCWGDYDGAVGDCKRLDADGDRDIDVDDYTIINNYVAARHSEAALQRIPAASYSRRGSLFAHQGLPLDAELNGYDVRHRWLSPQGQRFGQRDPLVIAGRSGTGYQDGLTLYGFVRANPIRFRDPLGLEQATGITISQTPFCLCGSKGHTWIDFAGGGSADFPSGYIDVGGHDCQRDHINNKWSLHIDDDQDTAQYERCVRDAMDQFDEDCRDQYGGSGYHFPDCTCRSAVDNALDECGGRKRLDEVDPWAPFTYCLSQCAKNPEDL
jgi:RHS repeat-associated protein